MNGAVPPAIRALRGALRRRLLVHWALLWLPASAGVLALSARYAGTVATVLVALGLTVAGAMPLRRRWRQLHFAALARQLNARCPAFEDSLQLLWQEPPGSPISQYAGQNLLALLRARLQQRLRDTVLPDLRPPYPWRAIALSLTVGLLAAALAYRAPPLPAAAWHLGTRLDTAGAATASGETELEIVAPAYTGLGTQRLWTWDAKVPVGSEVRFRIRLPDAQTAAALQFQDGSRLSLHRDGRDWRGSRVIETATLYRLEPTTPEAATGRDLADRDAGWHRLDLIADRPPEIKVRLPEKTLTVVDAQPGHWPIDVEARDDYGLGTAELSLTLTEGSGENTHVSRRTLALNGDGDHRHRRYRSVLDLAELGYARGDDLIVRIAIRDNREPQANLAQSASYILRWPETAAADTSGLVGLTEKVAPAYFRSQRQLIIDTEALVAARAQLAPETLAHRCDDLGVDQKVLRLRYGQFLGEEFESSHEQAPGAEHAAAQGEAAAALANLPPDDDHAAAANAAGSAQAVIQQYGHMHDHPEAATLLDPETKALLKAALDQMWQAELQLRQAAPETALPYEYRALEKIKQVQQTQRIYLARTGIELPQIDPARRLSGERDKLRGLDTGRDTATTAAAHDDAAVIRTVWDALADDRGNAAPAPESMADTPAASGAETAAKNGSETGATTPAQLQAALDPQNLRHWLQAHPQAADPLSVLEQAARLRADPSCARCRERLRELLWPLLPSPPAAVTARRAADAAGRAYLQALPAAGDAAHDTNGNTP